MNGQQGYYTPLMSGMLLGSIDLSTLASRGARIADDVAVVQLSRLAEVAGDGLLHVVVAVTVDDAGRVRVNGSVQGELAMQCQRCLEAVPVGLDAEMKLAVAATDSTAAPDGVELIVGDARDMLLRELLEDEILLALPQSPVHEDASACGELATLMGKYRQTELASEGRKMAHPFAELNKLKPK